MIFKTYASILAILLLILLSCSKKESEQQALTADSSKSELPAQYQKLIGIEFGPDSFPAGFEEKTGYVFGFTEGDEYVIDHVTNGPDNLLWFCKLTRRDTEGRPYLKILDMVILPKFQPDEILSIGNCNYHQEPDPEIVALVTMVRNEITTEVHYAWRANRQNGKFQTVPKDSVQCLDESFFL
jgi:hypothetical protein